MEELLAVAVEHVSIVVKMAICHVIAQNLENKVEVAELATTVTKKAICQETVHSQKTRIIGVVVEVEAEAATLDLLVFQEMTHLWMTQLELEAGTQMPTMMVVTLGAHLELLTGITQVLPQNLAELVVVVVGVNLKHLKQIQSLQEMIGMLLKPFPISQPGQTLGRM